MKLSGYLPATALICVLLISACDWAGSEPPALVLQSISHGGQNILAIGTPATQPPFNRVAFYVMKGRSGRDWKASVVDSIRDYSDAYPVFIDTSVVAYAKAFQPAHPIEVKDYTSAVPVTCELQASDPVSDSWLAHARKLDIVLDDSLLVIQSLMPREAIVDGDSAHAQYESFIGLFEIVDSRLHLVKALGPGEFPQFSEDGSELFFVRAGYSDATSFGLSKVYSFDCAEGGPLEHLLTAPGQVSDLQCARISGVLYFNISGSGGENGIWSFNRTDSTRTLLLGEESGRIVPTYRLCSDKIVYIAVDQESPNGRLESIELPR